MITAQAFSSIEAIERAAWNDCFPGALENWEYYLAVEKARIDDFEWRYLALFEEGRLLAVAPAFITRYKLDTTVQGTSKRITGWINRILPGLLEFPLYAIGSPVAERCSAGTASHVPTQQRQALLERLLVLAREDATALKIRLTAVKDAPSADDDWNASCKATGFQKVLSLPSALLPIPFGSVDAYLGTLGKSTRKDLRRKLRAPGPRIEWRRNIDDVLPQIMRLYEATLERSETQFERLPADYFTSVLEHLDERAACVLYWIDEQLVAFNLILLDGERLIDKFFGHDLNQSREHNLYFRSWLANVEYCIREGIPLYECGQAGYASKIRLGCTFQGNNLFFHHRNWLINNVLRLVKLFIRPDRFDPAMAAAISET
ncbi:GNAT family N-acetyltransferase [Pseudomonas gingeri]|uniref:GNAT family N-acetyltransferase n=1 Tax=Pseudomonas gingeri TaxID=117681 RepID=UPI0015A29893|nr:GNAT family N-acetyltransferase [Pseudomonas gingeri]NWA13707.1 GNAT family N-acetyltransferase [Pseudomonas gingeri]NWA52933.1 GNAT family N-acetyltransferase [Pseudomonas gingeri]NWA96430.1 GNAT family N-acetyltransferase [Pseudomonas gingeri]NWA99933.1 GNAT family N-acetyltransferase [Pseudomonas gingeri]